MSLDSLRKMRAQTVESLMMELAQVSQTLARNEERYPTIQATVQADTESYAQQTMQGLTIEALLEWQGRMDAQRAVLRQVRQELDHATRSWHHTKLRIVEANQECKILDRIAEKRQEAVRAAAGRQEQQATDEAASRRSSAGGMSHA